MLAVAPLAFTLVMAAADDRFAPSSARGTFVAESADAAPHMGIAGSLSTSWAKDPYVLRAPDGTVRSSLVPQQLTTTALASLGLFDRLELSVRASAIVEERAGHGFGAALASPRVAAKLHALDLGPVALGARAGFDIPLTLDTPLNDVAVAPALLASADFGFVRFGADVGARLSRADAKGTWALGAAVPLFDGCEIVGDVFGDASLASDALPVEGAAGVRFAAGPVDVVAGVGGGLVAGPGTPAARAFAGLSFTLDPVQPAPVVEEEPVPLVARAPEPPPPAPPAAAPAPAPVVEIVEDEIRFDETRVFFGFESATLTADGKAVLDEVARLLGAHDEIERVVIEGHADARGIAGYNKKLSLWRAQAVRDYLVEAGVDRARLRAVGAGTAKPAAPNGSREGRRQNRRVELHIVANPVGGAQ